MLIKHRQSAYVDDEELERTAGLMEIKAQSVQSDEEALAYGSVACALRLLQRRDVRDAREFERVFYALMFG